MSQTEGTQWGTVNCTFRGHRQPVRQGAHSGAQWGSQPYIQRAQTTSQTGGTGALSTVHIYAQLRVGGAMH